MSELQRWVRSFTAATRLASGSMATWSGIAVFSMIFSVLGSVEIKEITEHPKLIKVDKQEIISVEVQNTGTETVEEWELIFGGVVKKETALKPDETRTVSFKFKFEDAGWKTLKTRQNGRDKEFDRIYCFIDTKSPDRYKIGNAQLDRYFVQPPNIFRMVQYTHTLDRKTVDTYRDFNIGGMLSFLEKFLYSKEGEGPVEIHQRIEYATKNGFLTWLGDDFGYPSGLGGGYTVKDNPEYQVRGLVCIPFDGSGLEEKTFALPESVNEGLFAVVYPVESGEVQLAEGKMLPLENGTVTVSAVSNEWKCCIFGLQSIDKESQAQTTMAQFGHDGRYPDLLNPDAVKKFITVMHKKYMEELKKTGTEVEGFYTNEPNLMKMYWRYDGSARKYPYQSWNKYFAAEFEKMHGYDIRPKLCALYEGDSLEAKRVRLHYFQTIGELFSENYARQITKFCHDNGVKSGGHYLLNEYLPMHVAGYGDMLKFAAAWDIPGLDIGVPKSHLREAFPYHQTKLFSSASYWNGSDTTTMLLDPIIGGSGLDRLSPPIPVLRHSANMGYLYGANKMSTYAPLFPREEAGGAKATGYDKQEYSDICDYIGRLAVMLRGAANNTSIAVYYPIATFQSEYKASPDPFTRTVSRHQSRQESFDSTIEAVLNAGLDFNILHPEAVAEAKVKDGALTVGMHSYKYLVMPQMNIMPLRVMVKLRKFESGGGTVLWIERKPVAAERAENQAAVMGLSSIGTVVGNSDLVAKFIDPYDDEFSLKLLVDPKIVSITRFNRNNQKLYYLVNRTPDAVTVPLNASAGRPIRFYDPFTGKIMPLKIPAKIEIEGYGSVILAHE